MCVAPALAGYALPLWPLNPATLLETVLALPGTPTHQAYPTDLTEAAAVKATIAAVQSDLGPVDLLFWNPISTPAPLLTATPEQLTSAYNVTVTGAWTGYGALCCNKRAGLRGQSVSSVAIRRVWFRSQHMAPHSPLVENVGTSVPVCPGRCGRV
jgi:NAD(P)-dependent dehydrogenase (short-subunit alcohol dehydrogenase family)